MHMKRYFGKIVLCTFMAVAMGLAAYCFDFCGGSDNAANLGSMGSMMGASADYDSQVMPIVQDFLKK